ATRTTLRVDVIRDRGALGREVPGGLIENVYRLQIINSDEGPIELDLRATGVPGLALSVVDQDAARVRVDGSATRLVPVVLRAPIDGLKPGLYDIQFETSGERASGQAAAVIEQSSFYVPN